MTVSSLFSETVVEAIARAASEADVDIIADAAVSRLMATEAADAAVPEAAAEADTTAIPTKARHRRRRGPAADVTSVIGKARWIGAHVFMIVAAPAPGRNGNIYNQCLGVPRAHLSVPFSHNEPLPTLYQPCHQ